jgi:REP element-mobilizing transposase RayT
MTNHLHLIAKTQEGFELSWNIRDFEKYTFKQNIKAIEENQQESRKKSMLSLFSACL